MDPDSEKSPLVQNHRRPQEQYELSQLNQSLYSDNRPTQCSIKELQELVETKGKESVEKIQKKYGTQAELCKKLKSGIYI